MSKAERTLSIIKPDAVERNLDDQRQIKQASKNAKKRKRKSKKKRRK